MVQQHDNSIVSGGLDHVLIEEGRVINVNMPRWTADVRTEVNQSEFLDLQWGNPYLHFNSGEGIFAMPEVGAKCKVCRPSDSPPFIMCFTTTFERNMSASEDQGGSDMSEGEEQSNSNISFAAGRPDLQQGDIMMRGRDGNQIWLRRGGVVEIGSTHISKRIYIPLLNYIRDFCENYSLQTFGGDLSWTVKRVDDDPAGESKAVLKVAAKQAAQDEKASVSLRIGSVTDEDLFDLTVAPTSINMETYEVEDGPLYQMKVDSEGSVTITSKKDATITIEGDLSETVEGSATYTYQGGHTVDVTGDQEISISGSHKLTAPNSEENCSGSKVINSASIELGGSGSQPICLFPALNAWLASHSHPPTGGPPVAPPPPFQTNITKAK